MSGYNCRCSCRCNCGGNRGNDECERKRREQELKDAYCAGFKDGCRNAPCGRDARSEDDCGCE